MEIFFIFTILTAYIVGIVFATIYQLFETSSDSIILIIVRSMFWPIFILAAIIVDLAKGR